MSDTHISVTVESRTSAHITLLTENCLRNKILTYWQSYRTLCIL